MRSVPVILTLLLGTSTAMAQVGPRGGKIDWRHDHDSALRDGLRLGRPLMVYFTADD